ncbi:MAG: hypothetical protein ACE5GU_10390 [Candidatus Scalinduaceae bacterium]
MTKDFKNAFDPCLYWDCTKIAFAGVHKKGGGSQIWGMNIDDSWVRQMTDLLDPVYRLNSSIDKQ